MVISLVEKPIDIGVVLDAVRRPGAGAASLFVGTVRDHSEGRAINLLEYEAYAPMALEEIRRCIDEISVGSPEIRLAVIHRVGALSVGEIAVACAASAPHRAEAFSACRALIDAIKARVPIWKREHGPDGAHWVGWRDARCGDDHVRAVESLG